MARRDPGEFQRVFDELYPRAYALAHRILWERAAAEAVATEALARAYARWRRVRNLPHTDGWVLRLTGNLATASVGRFSATPTPLSEALAALPADIREPVVLRYLTDLDADDVALVLGVPTETVSARLAEGLATLRDQLGPMEGSGVSHTA